MPIFGRKYCLFSFCLTLFFGVAVAEPWAEPGDLALRHDVQLLSDHHVLTHPITTWPVSWPDIATQLKAVDDDVVAQLPVRVQLAWQRLQWRLRQARKDGLQLSSTLRVGSQPNVVRNFAKTSRGDYEANSEISWMGDDFALKLSLTAIENDPFDEQSLRLDGSYVAGVVGNWMFSLGAQDRWWGPGWRGSLILGNNARPVPGIAVQRKIAKSFESPWLRWIGPWQFNMFVGQLESDRATSKPVLWTMRGSFRPTKTLEIGLSRAIQMCGGDRPCGLDTFVDAFVGNDNDTGNATEPGNQLAGYDFRWSPIMLGRPVAFYAQLIGEDEAGGLPSKLMGQFGVETSGGLDLSGLGFAKPFSWRVYVEHVDLTADFYAGQPAFNAAYNNSIYPDGYTYRGRVLSHALDSDSRYSEVGGIVVSNDWAAFAALGAGTVNRDGGGRNGLSAAAADITLLEAQVDYFSEYGRFGVNMQWLDLSASTGSDASLNVTWQRGFK